MTHEEPKISFQKYEEWKDGLPDMAWLKEVFPDNEQWQNFSNGVISVTEKFKDSIEIGEVANWMNRPTMNDERINFRSSIEEAR
jgi:optic atrophy protein 1